MFAVATLFALMTTPLLAATTAEPRLRHEPPSCLLQGHPSRISACGAGQGAHGGRLFFRDASSEHWYYVEMVRDGPCLWGTLPSPQRRVRRIAYFMETSTGSGSSRSAERTLRVVGDADACPRGAVAPIDVAEPAYVTATAGAPLTPAGFGEQGGRSKRWIAGLLVGGGAAATVGALAAASGDGGAPRVPEPTPVPTPTPPPTLPPTPSTPAPTSPPEARGPTPTPSPDPPQPPPPGPAPTATPTPRPGATATPTGTATATPTSSPTSTAPPTATPTPAPGSTPTPVPTSTPAPTPTVAPTATPTGSTPTPAPSPTSTPSPTATAPPPTPTPEPATPTPAPTSTPVPTPTPAPTATPTPAATATPTPGLDDEGGGAASVVWRGWVDVSDARARLFANGQLVAETGSGAFEVRFRAAAGENRLEVQLIGARGPGRVAVELQGAYDPSSLRVVFGSAAPSGATGVVALLQGRPGESFALSFRRPARGRTGR